MTHRHAGGPQLGEQAGLGTRVAGHDVVDLEGRPLEVAVLENHLAVADLGDGRAREDGDGVLVRPGVEDLGVALCEPLAQHVHVDDLAVRGELAVLGHDRDLLADVARNAAVSVAA